MDFIMEFWQLADRALVWMSWGVRGLRLFGLLPPAWAANSGLVAIVIVWAGLMIPIWAFFCYDEAPSGLQVATQVVICAALWLLPFDLPGPIEEIIATILAGAGVLGYLRPRPPKKEERLCSTK